MGLDGFSMGNLGLNSDLTSAQMANQAEMIARKESEIKIKDVTEMAKDDGVKRKKDSEEQDKSKNKQEKRKKRFKNEENKVTILNEKDFENKDPKDFSVRINQETDLIELFNNKEEKVLETINADELMGLISKLNHASGILVNRKI